MQAFELNNPIQIEGDAIFSRNRTNRMQLRRWWTAQPSRWVSWLMLNPSDAGETRNDPTMHRVIHFTRSWGYDGCIVVNLYPFISSDPREMWLRSAWQNNGPDWEARDDLHANLEHIERVGRLSYLKMVAFGAGPLAKDPFWVSQCIEAFSQPSDHPNSDGLLCLGVTAQGQPLHPLARGKMRVPNNAQPIRWED